MSVWRLVLQEVRHRKLNFTLALLSVVVAVGCFIGQVLWLEQHRAETTRILAERRSQSEKAAKELQDEIRKATKGLGFNLRILPKGVNLIEMYSNGTIDKTMPESHVEKLANTEIVTVNHLLPVLQQKVEWPELKLKSPITLIGTRGEVPIRFRDLKKPLQDDVPRGSIVLGDALALRLKNLHGKEIEEGAYVTFQGKKLRVHEVHPHRGNNDDATIWMNLKEVQEMLGKEGEINGILALGCNCAADRLISIRTEIENQLPDTQVDEHTMIATPRAKLRMKAARDAKQVETEEANHRAAIYAEQESFASIVIPLVVIGCLVWLAVVALANVFDRRAEIGVLRALGLRSRHILLLFLSKAVIVGLLGTVLGLLLGTTIVFFFADRGALSSFLEVLNPILFGLTLLIAPLVCLIASWLPALFAVQQDPAAILRDG